MREYITILILFFSSFTSLFSQVNNPTYWKHWTTMDGLGQSYIYSIAQDSFGFIWIGTQAGLNRFDGSEFKLFDATNSQLSNGYVEHLVMNSTGDTLWIGTSRGFFGMDIEKMEIFKPEQPASIDIKKMFLLKDTLFVNPLSSIKNNKNKKQYQYIYAGTELLLKQFQHKPSKLDTSIYDSRGRKWEEIETDKKSKLYCTFQNDSLVEARNDTLEIHVIFESRDSVIWVGTNNGLFSYADNRQIFVKEKIEKNIYATFPVLPENDEKGVWIGATDGLYFYLNGNTKGPFVDKKNTLKNVRTFFVENNKLYIGCSSGLYYTENKIPNSETKIIKIENINIKNIRYFYHDETYSRLWIGTDNSIHVADFLMDVKKISFKAYPIKRVNSFAGDKFDRLWIGSQEGLYYIHKNHIERTKLNVPKGFIYKDSTHYILSLLSIKNTLWVGTKGNGLIKYKLETPSIEKIFTTNDGLIDNTIYGIVQDKHDNLWLSTNKGISLFNPRTEKFINYDTRQGVNTELNSNSFSKDSLDNIYVGGVNGLYSFSPIKKASPTQAEIVVLLKQDTTERILKKSGETIWLSGQSDYHEISVSLNHYQSFNQNRFSFKFSSGFRWANNIPIPKQNSFSNKFILPDIRFGWYKLLISPKEYSGEPFEVIFFKRPSTQDLLIFVGMLFVFAIGIYFLLKKEEQEKSYKIIKFANDIGTKTRDARNINEFIFKIKNALMQGDTLKKILQADVFSIILYDSTIKKLVSIVDIEDGEELFDAETEQSVIYDLNEVDYPAVQCYNTGKVIFHPDRNKISNRQKPKGGKLVRSLLYVPIYGNEDEISGVATIQSYKPNQFTREHHMLFLEYVGIIVTTTLFGVIDKLNAELATERIKLLTPQMAPHFLSNAFVNIEVLISKNKDKAIKFTQDMSGICRNALEAVMPENEGVISLEDEIRFLKNFLRIMKERKDWHTLEWAFFIDEDLDLSMDKIPVLFLQPYIENAIKHGFPMLYIEQPDYPGKINIHFELEKTYLIIKIRDNGQGLLKTISNADHISRSNKINEERVSAINQLNKGLKQAMFLEGPKNRDDSDMGVEVMIKIRKDLLRTNYTKRL